MNTILLATDFSESSERAFRLMLPFADALRARIVFLHVEHIPATEIQASGGMLEQVMQHRHQAALEGLNSLKLATAEYAFNHNTSIESDHILTTGMVVEEILHAARELSPDYVVVGAPSHHSLMGIFSGNVAGVLVKKIKVPLWIVSEKCTVQTGGDILFASGWDEGDGDILRNLMTLAAQLRTNVRILHVTSKKESTGELEVESFINTHFSAELASGRLRSVVSYSNDIAAAIQTYAESNKVSMVVAGHHQHVWEAFRRQIAQEISQTLDVPVLVYQA